jgi:hypothetical protein
MERQLDTSYEAEFEQSLARALKRDRQKTPQGNSGRPSLRIAAVSSSYPKILRRRRSMKTNSQHEVVARITLEGLVLATLFAMLLSAGGISRAQSQSTPSKSAVASATTSAQAATVSTAPVTQVATPKPTTDPAAPAGQSTPKVRHEGITVHGHWTIEVREPDGAVVTHREFENSLLDPFVLGNLLGHALTPGGFSIALLGNCGSISYPSSNGGLAGPTSYGSGCVLYESDSVIGANFYTGLLESVPNYLGLDNLGYGADCSHGNSNCYGVLSVTTDAGNPGAGNFVTLQATIQLPSTLGVGNISAVYARMYTCAPTVSPSSCVNPGDNISTYPPSLYGYNYLSIALTGTTLPSSVTVSGGQSISVTVQISFSSQ